MSYDLQATDLNPAWLDRVKARPTADGRTPQVLVVHEDRNLREVLKLHLATAGYTATGISRPDEIARELERRDTDLVIVDMALPNVHGIEFFVAETDGGLIPLLFLTADKQTRVRAERLGAIACETQPVYADVFLEAVVRALESKDKSGMRAGLRPPRASEQAA